jgi:hypothetical protein
MVNYLLTNAGPISTQETGSASIALCVAPSRLRPPARPRGQGVAHRISTRQFGPERAGTTNHFWRIGYILTENLNHGATAGCDCFVNALQLTDSD